MQMVNYLGFIIAFLITFPFIPTLFVYKISEKAVNHKLRAFHIAINGTTILYILATIQMLNMMFEYQFIGIVIGLVLLLLTVIIVWQWKTKTEILIDKAFKILWRLCFLIFLFSYIILSIYGITNRILF